MSTLIRDETWNPFIGGASRPPASASYFQSRNPADGEVIAEVGDSNESDVDYAVANAKAAQRLWNRVPASERGRVISRIAIELRNRSEEYARVECLDNGKPISQARFDIEYSARYFEFYGGLADKINGDNIPLGPAYHSFTMHEPYGVIGMISPWNAPLMQVARGAAPALVAGNSVVVKPAEDTPLTALMLAELAIECGLPAGVLNVVPGFGATGATLVNHPHVDKIAFTGSVPTGRAIALAAAERLVPLTLELGGKSANIVFADADLDAAIPGALAGINLNAGQNCSAGSRLFVHDNIYDELVSRLVELDRKVTLGPGLEDPDMGPIATEQQFNHVKHYLELARTEGAFVACGGGASRDERLQNGYFIEPTVFLDVNNKMRIAQEEIFGPVLCVLRFSDDDEVVAMANDSNYGLVAGIWTRDAGRVHRVSGALDVGQVYVNEYFAGGVETPFGGTKQSGYGREKGLEAMSAYTHTKTVIMRIP
jgi:aldehyde dehydrogenase (NAD+)